MEKMTYPKTDEYLAIANKSLDSLANGRIPFLSAAMSSGKTT